MEQQPSQMIRRIQQAAKKEIIKKRQAKVKRFTKWALFLLGIFLFGLAVLWYHQSPYSKIKAIVIHNENILTEKEIIELLPIKVGDHLYSFSPNKLAKTIPTQSIIETLDIKRNWFSREVHISISEKKIAGYYLTDRITLVALDGSEKDVLKNQMELIENKVRFSNFDKNQLKILVDSISRSDYYFYSNISEILREPRSYDENYLKLIMADGIVLYTDLYSFENLKGSLYKEMVNRIEDKQRCIVYDVFWKSSYAKPCQNDEIHQLQVEKDEKVSENEANIATDETEKSAIENQQP